VGPRLWNLRFGLYSTLKYRVWCVGQRELHRRLGDPCTRGSCSQFENNYLTEMCSGSQAGSCLSRIDFVCHATLGLKVYHSTLGVRVITKKKKKVLDAEEHAEAMHKPIARAVDA